MEETAVFSNMLCKECSPLQLRKGGARLVRSESFTGETFTVAWQGAHGKLVYMKIATWNVNSIRARADRIEDWLDKTEVDVLALQETKTKDETFPFELFEFLGYEVAHYGLNQWNGVAIASRVGLDSVERAFPNQPAFGKPGDPAEIEARAIGATCNGVRIWSLYVPNGRGLTDPHMPYKMEWMRQLRTNVNGWLHADPAAQFALVGDWNVAPEDTDVWDIDFFRENDLTHVSAPNARHSMPCSMMKGSSIRCAPTPRASTPTGTTKPGGSRRMRGCASTFSCAPRRSPPVWKTPGSIGKSAKGTVRATIPPW
ncbi:exodeoxyribonuclease III [Rothia aeria]|uniref:Exodeoxyribonuclease III n=1 Tax=Rothia aeria TaxID=172042 RepID=A0A2Z5QX10_9MICC|nr:exodeoxyribonuclease III [Rothia aeria]